MESETPLSFARNLFFGDVEEDQVFPFPDPLTPERRRFLADLLEPLDRFLAERVDSAVIDRDSTLP